MSPRRHESVGLSEIVGLDVNYQRSVKADSALSVDLLASGYIPTERALDMITRVVGASQALPQVRAWSVTGPYGSGKSSFLAFLAVLLGNRNHPAYVGAFSNLHETSPMLAAETLEVRARANAEDKGYILAIATAGKESANRVVARALLNGAEAYWLARGRGGRPRLLQQARRLAAVEEPNTDQVLELLYCLENFAPVLLAVDEFGKVLEHAADAGNAADLYVLQLVAEHFSSSDSVASCLLTLQHLAMSDYAQSLPLATRQEWLKIQGRFQDVSFLTSVNQSISFIRGHISRRGSFPGFRKAVGTWGRRARLEAETCGVPHLISLCSAAEDIYPIHPLALVLAPAIAQAYGQGDRSLHSWLASGEPASVSGFLNTQSFSPSCPLPVYGLDELYDFFLDASTGSAQTARMGSRVLEILGRIREATGLPELEAYLLRSIGLLNLAAQAGDLEASPGVLEFAAAVQGLGRPDEVRAALHSLVVKGFVVFRHYANEYRVWQGSDVDVDACVAAARDGIAGDELWQQLDRLSPASAKVAQRHGHRTGTFRYFRTVYSRGVAKAAELECLVEQADGLVVLSFVQSGESGVPDAYLEDGRPIVVCQSPDLAEVSRALANVAALSSVADNPLVLGDAVARREVRERLAAASDTLSGHLRRAFDPRRQDLHWFAAGQRVALSDPLRLSALLSDVCDEVFCAGLPLRNEILNRVQLTSQGAKARRVLLEGLVAHPDKPAFGIDGFGPERSMYESLFRALGLHARSGSGADWELAEPTPGSPAYPAWRAIEDFVRETDANRKTLDLLFGRLSQPPYGIRKAVVPVVALTYLALHREDVAVYQDGSFEPELTDPMMERLLKAPERFAVRRVSDGGLRAMVIEEILSRFGVARSTVGVRNASLIAALRPLFATVRALTDYGRYSTHLSSRARAVRSAVMGAQELDELLFIALPKAVGLKPFGLDAAAKRAVAKDFADRLAEVLSELAGSYDDLLFAVEDQLAGTFNIPPGGGVRGHLRERARRMSGQVIDARLRSFILYALDPNLPDRGWLEAMCMSLAEKPPSSWRDADLEIFSARLRELAGLFARVEHLCSAIDAEQRADGFVARRVAVTRADGAEASRVVWVDNNELERLQVRVLQVLKDLRSVEGDRSAEAFLAVLADEVLSSDDDTELDAGDLGAEVGKNDRRRIR